jgi:hypothetical protein
MGTSLIVYSASLQCSKSGMHAVQVSIYLAANGRIQGELRFSMEVFH